MRSTGLSLGALLPWRLVHSYPGAWCLNKRKDTAGRVTKDVLFAGAMPFGGIAELKRRKKEQEEAEKAAAGVVEEQKPSEAALEQKQQPGQLQHVSLLTLVHESNTIRVTARLWRLRGLLSVAAFTDPGNTGLSVGVKLRMHVAFGGFAVYGGRGVLIGFPTCALCSARGQAASTLTSPQLHLPLGHSTTR